jgi:hypothetical protein
VNQQNLLARFPESKALKGEEPDQQLLQKLAVRVSMDRLVKTGGFKFRRSAFSGQEPKATLLVPQAVGICADSFPINFSVNVKTPFCQAALLTECGRMDPRAKDLILLVKRWAKDRGICHASKGHLSPYQWSLLCIYFLQVGIAGGEHLLPALECFELPSYLATDICTGEKKLNSKDELHTRNANSNKSIGSLFKDFLTFFAQFDWAGEAVSIRLARREPPSSELPLHIIVADDTSASEVGPSIEDPFKKSNNLGDGMTTFGLTRLRKELFRAHALCTEGASLSEILQPWVPDETEAENICESADRCNNQCELQPKPQVGNTKPQKHCWRSSGNLQSTATRMHRWAEHADPVSSHPWRRSA